MLCPKCRTQVPDSASSCPYCGERFAQPPPPPGPPRTSRMAIASLILAILGGLVITALLGLVFGIIAIVQIGRSRGRLRGQGLAIAGAVISALALLFLPIMAAMVFPVFMRARETARKAVCLSNVKNLCLALQMYMEDNDDRLPDAEDWCGGLEDYVKRREVYLCPAAQGLDCAYAYNSDLSRADLEAFADLPTTVAIFESDFGWNASGLPEDLLTEQPRHLRGDNFGYLDGHAQWAPRGAPRSSGRFAD